MPFNQEKIVAANQSSIDTLHSYSSSVLTGAARIAALNLNAAQDLLAESSGHAKALFGARDLHELQSLQGSLLQPGVEKSVSYLRSIQEISRGVQEQLHSAIETQFSALQKQAGELIDRTARHAPAGSDVAIAGVRSAFSAANSAFGKLSKAARQVSDIADANLSAAGSATVRAVTPASGKKKAA